MTNEIEIAARLIASNVTHMATAKIRESASFYTAAAKTRAKYEASAAIFRRALEIRNAEFPGNF